MKLKALIAASVLGATAGLASGEVILSWGYTDLDGSFDGTTFRAVAGVSSSGDVTRLADPTSTAEFDAGFITRSAMADVLVAITVSNIGGVTADGSGSFTLTDDDGDTITGDIDGVFINGGFGFVFFNGLLSNVVLNGNPQGGNTFNGVDGGSFDMDLPGETPYEGAIISLFLDPSSGFFTQTFDGVSVQVDGEIIPAPASLALLGLGGLVGMRRRR